jgi:hypothetical protein
MDGAGNTEMDDRVAMLEERLKKMEARRVESARGLFSRIIPPEVRRHFMAGQREQLLAARALVDFWIDKLDSHAADAPKSAEREDIPIE